MKKVDHPASKRYKEVKKLVDKNKKYPLEEALELVKKTSTTKFDSSVEVHFKLNLNLKKNDQQVRGYVSLPHGTGKSVKVAVIASEPSQQKAAKDAGADLVGEVDLLEEIKKGHIDFDVLVATPDTMRILAPAAKILGPKGLMPNPKDGTVTTNITEVVSNLKKGKVNFKNDDSGNLHVMIGKTSFETVKLVDNFQVLLNTITKAKPSSIKGVYIKSITLASSMGPGVKISL
ncbi:MAG: 50S ribosomal protein L1 [Patescibacteria group bacterium]